MRSSDCAFLIPHSFILESDEGGTDHGGEEEKGRNRGGREKRLSRACFSPLLPISSIPLVLPIGKDKREFIIICRTDAQWHDASRVQRSSGRFPRRTETDRPSSSELYQHFLCSSAGIRHLQRYNRNSMHGTLCSGAFMKRRDWDVGEHLFCRSALARLQPLHCAQDLLDRSVVSKRLLKVRVHSVSFAVENECTPQRPERGSAA